jgi:succinate dehydrogenase/fumarate reductase cytochrome b subunit
MKKITVSNSEISALMLASSASLLGSLALTSSPMTLAITTILAGGLASQIWEKQLTPIWKWSRRYRLPGVFFVGSSALYLFNALASPASAQFMNNAQNWMQGVFPQGGNAIPLVFNVLRGLFLLYLAISIVQVVQAGRNDEDWKTLARTPLIILIAVVLGDVLTGFIIGTGGNP